MAEAETKPPIRNETTERTRPAAPDLWRPFESLRREMNRLFDEVDRGDFRFPFGRALFGLEAPRERVAAWRLEPVVDVVERDKAYELTAELPGVDASDVEVKVSSGMLTIEGEKKAAKEEKRKDFYFSERRYGSFQRAFALPEGVDADKIEASFRNGVLKIVLPKTAEALKQEKKVAVKAG